MDILRTQEWMEPSTLKQALDKAERINENYGFPVSFSKSYISDIDLPVIKK